jgi:hypothetical protein
LGGCVHRQLVITSDPPGAIVQINGKTIGPTPVDYPFTFYGIYHIVLIHDGRQTQIINQPVYAPWYQWLGLDFISENLVPCNIRDIRTFHYCLPELQFAPPESVLEHAEMLRIRGQGIGEPPHVVPVQAVPGPPPVPGAETLPVPAVAPPGTIPGAAPVPQVVPPGTVPPVAPVPQVVPSGISGS